MEKRNAKGSGTTPQGRRQLFGLDMDNTSCLRHVTISSHLCIQCVREAVVAKEDTKIFLECCFLHGFTPMCLVAYKENEPSQFRLGAVHSLHPNQVVTVELMYTFSGYQASNIHIYNIEKEYPRFTAYYLNVIDESFVASDGCISSSPDGPSSIEVLHLNMSLIPKNYLHYTA